MNILKKATSSCDKSHITKWTVHDDSLIFGTVDGGAPTWRLCWGDRGGDREDRLGMLVMEGVPGIVRLDALCVPALNDRGPGALKSPPSRPVFAGSDPVSFIPAPSQDSNTISHMRLHTHFLTCLERC